MLGFWVWSAFILGVINIAIVLYSIMRNIRDLENNVTNLEGYIDAITDALANQQKVIDTLVSCATTERGERNDDE